MNVSSQISCPSGFFVVNSSCFVKELPYCSAGVAGAREESGLTGDFAYHDDPCELFEFCDCFDRLRCKG